MKRKMKGFTLIEMIITITVIIILSAISVPIYKNYQEDAIIAEGYVLLSAIREAQKQYYSEWGNFLYCYDGCAGLDVYTANEEILGIDARGNKYFTSFCISNDGTGGTRKKYYFAAFTHYRKGSENNIILQYNLSLGQRVTFGDRDPSFY